MRNQLPGIGGPQPSPDEVPGGRAEGVQPAGLQPASGIETIPGYTFPTDPPATSPRVDAVSARLDALEDYAAGIERQLFESAAARIAALEDTQRHFNAVLEGSVGTKLERINGVALKLAKKLNKSADQRLSNAYSYALELGGHYPAKEDVIYGLQTGDYLGSMGVSPPIGSNGTVPAIPPVPTPTGPAGTYGPEGLDPGDEPGPGDDPEPDPTPVEPFPPGGGIIEDPTFPPAPGGGGGGGGYTVSCSSGVVQMTLGGSDCAGVYAWFLNGAPGFYPAPDNDASCLSLQIPGGWCNLWGQNPDGSMGFQVYVPCGCSLWVPEGGGRGVIVCGNPPPGYCYVYANTASGAGGTGPGPPPPVGPGAGTCKPPDEMKCGVPLAMPNLVPPMPSGPDVCAMMEESIKNATEATVKVTDWIGALAGDKDGSSVADDIIAAITGGNEPVLSNLINRFSAWLQRSAETNAREIKCGDAAVGSLAAKQAIFGFIQQWTGAVPLPVMTFLNQMWNWVCPTQMPTGPETDEAYLADAISADEWECWHKFNGDHIAPAKKQVQGKRARLGVREAYFAYLRGYITPQRYQDLARAAGVIDEKDRQDFEAMTDHWPGPSDLIRFMGKDAFDQAAIDKFRLLEGFDEKWGTNGEYWGKGAGLTKDVAKLHWISHWQHVGTHTMFEALHRLRPGVAPPGTEVTEQDVRQSLLQQDYMPYWVDRMVALSYRVVTRTDANRLYELHAIDEEQLYGYVQDEGFKPEDAKALVEGAKKRRKVQEVKRSGLPTARTLINQYARGETTAREFQQVAQKISLNDDQAQQMVESAELARTVRNRTQMIRGIRANYLHGVIDEPEAHEALADIGVDGDEVGELVQQWTLERSAKAKMPTAERLCKWRALGLIGPSDQARALVRLGWDSDDAYRIVTTCEGELDEKQKQAAAKAAKAAARQYVQQRVETVRQCTERQKAMKGNPCADPQPRPVVG